MNVLSFGASTGERDWIPDRAIGPTEEALYKREADYHDRELSSVLKKPLGEVQMMDAAEKRNPDEASERRTAEINRFLLSPAGDGPIPEFQKLRHSNKSDYGNIFRTKQRKRSQG